MRGPAKRVNVGSSRIQTPDSVEMTWPARVIFALPAITNGGEGWGEVLPPLFPVRDQASRGCANSLAPAPTPKVLCQLALGWLDVGEPTLGHAKLSP